MIEDLEHMSTADLIDLTQMMLDQTYRGDRGPLLTIAGQLRQRKEYDLEDKVLKLASACKPAKGREL